jgi:hypothetical protein
MLKKVKRLAAAAGVAAVVATISVTGATAGVASARVLGSSGIVSGLSPVVWNGTDLVTAAVGANGTLYAYEQVPGASAWQRQTVETQARNGGAALGAPSVTATATSVQVVSEDADGKIWFYQQLDGQSTWSAPQLVAQVSVGQVVLAQQPKIAWTGVPGHTGTNSVITIANAAGDVLFWYQSGAGWAQETVASPTQGVGWGAPDLTATSTGVVIAAVGTNGAFYTFFQPYGGPAWASDGTLGASARQFWGPPALTWDGVNVTVAAAFTDGTGITLRFMWKSNSAQFWSQETLPGVTDAQFLAQDPAITWTGGNLLVAAVQQLTGDKQRLDFWWQGSTFTTFTRETVTAANYPDAFGPAALTYDPASPGEAVITVPFTTNAFQTTTALDDWTEPTGGTVWTKHQVNAP